MSVEKLNKLADLLLDTGKRNNLMNFRDARASSVEVIAPDYVAIASRLAHSSSFEVYDPKLVEEDFDDYATSNDFGYSDFGTSKYFEEPEKVVGQNGAVDSAKTGRKDYGEKSLFNFDENHNDCQNTIGQLSKSEYLEKYKKKIAKNQILIYNSSNKPMLALKSVQKRAKTYVEETGVNIAYLAMGFIKWAEKDNSNYFMHAPILLLPIIIEKSSSVNPFVLKIADDEVIVNPTFSFKLQNEFGITLPDFDLGDDIANYFDLIESMISKVDWCVERNCKIGLFSFMKINMYQDIKDNVSKIASDKNVKILLGDSEQTSSTIWQGIEEIGGYNKLDLHNVVDADSSQMEAIEMAKQGVSFVLQGPPGTGKSQTITNIIAESLYAGKKVLFVSEKLAALKVVYEKLQRVGLDEFCLELHSHKSNKKAVIEELCKTMRLPKSRLSEQAEKEQKIKNLEQQRLDIYAKVLHEKQAVIGKSLFELFALLSACRQAPYLDYAVKNLSSKGEDYLDDVLGLLEKFVDYQSVIGYDYKKHVWCGYKGEECLSSEKNKFRAGFLDFADKCKKLLDINKKIVAKYDVDLKNLKNLHLYLQLFEFLSQSKFMSSEFLSLDCAKNARLTVKKQWDIAKNIVELKKQISADYDEEIFDFNAKNIQKKLKVQFGSMLSRMFSKEYKNIITDLKLASKGKKIGYKIAVKDIEALANYQSQVVQFAELEKSIENCLNDNYNQISTDFQRFISELDSWISLYDNIKSQENLQKFVSGYDSASQNFFVDIASELQNVFDDCKAQEENIISAFDKDMFDVELVTLDKLITKLSICADNMDSIVDWCGAYRLLTKLKEKSLIDFVDLAILQNLASQNIVPAFQKVFYSAWVEMIMRNNEVMTFYPRVHHDKSVELFREKDRLEFEINKAIINAELSKKRPDLNLVAQGSSVAKLLREEQKKRKQKSVRTLFAEMSDLIQTLKPCMLMSPLSVSTFLSADVEFDIVIFDEASQIFPQDAIGVIYRGKQLVVVGDSRQMPPSKFFISEFSSEEEDEEEDFADFESILDLCTVSFPQCRLKWHYRSKYEHLIAFSNKNFYDSNLVTFPSTKADGIDIGVDYTYVDGTFDRKSKTNRVEAEKIVDMVFDHAKRYPNRSLGVVAFSISQQGLIEKLISKRREAAPSFEEFFSEQKLEPFFVKNLETVQGDERDTIIFSIAYAKDAGGKLLMNFGPLNRAGGERRLNVAVTRAKYNLKVVTSMHYTDIDLQKAKSVGAHLLCDYLHYAEMGFDGKEQESVQNVYGQSTLDFEEEVAEFLTAKGYTVDMRVGRSSFKIDMAIKKPDSGDYVLAIECDGENYRTAKTTRDRDRLRQDILENMGWNFYRIWSADWYKNKYQEQERLLQAVKDAFENIAKQESKVVTEVNFEEQVETKPFEFPKYKKANELQLARSFRNNTLKTILAIMEIEAPISEDWLLKRISFMFGREKVTSVVLQNYNYYMRNCASYGIVRKDGFLYLDGKQVPMLRVPAVGDIPREIKHIAPAELAKGLLEVVRENISVDKNNLFKSLAKKLGFSRVGDSILECMNKALKLISNFVDIEDEMVVLKD